MVRDNDTTKQSLSASAILAFDSGNFKLGFDIIYN